MEAADRLMDWADTAHRTFWTFIEAFIGVLAGTYAFAIEGAAVLSAVAAGVAAAIVPLKEAALANRRRKAD
jgi:hypothetical protein